MLNSKQRNFLRAKAHHLKPNVIIGKADINKSVIKAVNQCLNSHELIKIKFNNYKDSKDGIIVYINEETKSECVGVVGNIAIIFRQNIDIEDRIYKLD